jgi:hypothetical protein
MPSESRYAAPGERKLCDVICDPTVLHRIASHRLLYCAHHNKIKSGHQSVQEKNPIQRPNSGNLPASLLFPTADGSPSIGSLRHLHCIQPPSSSNPSPARSSNRWQSRTKADSTAAACRPPKTIFCLARSLSPSISRTTPPWAEMRVARGRG